jgi:hypothetical protein
LLQQVVCGNVAGGEEDFACRPGQLVVVCEVIAVVSDLLVSAVFAVAVDRVEQELPAELCLVQVGSGSSGISLLEQWRGSALGQGGHSGGCGSGVFGQTTCASPLSGADVVFVLAFARVDDEVEPAVGILQLGEVIGFPLGFLQMSLMPSPLSGSPRLSRAETPLRESAVNIRYAPGWRC